jgi:hypothetical protein
LNGLGKDFSPERVQPWSAALSLRARRSPIPARSQRGVADCVVQARVEQHDETVCASLDLERDDHALAGAYALVVVDLDLHLRLVCVWFRAVTR